MKIKLIHMLHAISVGGTSIAGDMTVGNPHKHLNMELGFETHGVLVKQRDVEILIPYANIKCVVVEKDGEGN